MLLLLLLLLLLEYQVVAQVQVGSVPEAFGFSVARIILIIGCCCSRHLLRSRWRPLRIHARTVESKKQKQIGFILLVPPGALF